MNRSELESTIANTEIFLSHCKAELEALNKPQKWEPKEGELCENVDGYVRKYEDFICRKNLRPYLPDIMSLMIERETKGERPEEWDGQVFYLNNEGLYGVRFARDLAWFNVTHWLPIGPEHEACAKAWRRG